MEPEEVEHNPISFDLARSLIYYARQHPKNEVCGFILDRDSYISIKNCSTQPWHNFRMSEPMKVEVVKNHGDSIIGIFHSHPSGSAIPSANDIIGWPHDEAMNFCRYWIVTCDKVVEWQFVVNEVFSKAREVWRYDIGPQESLAESASPGRSEV